MHIGFLNTYFSRKEVGGGEMHTQHLAEALESRSHDVTIFTDEPLERRDGIDHLDVWEYKTPAKVNPINELSLGYRARGDAASCDVVVLTDDSAWLGVDLPVPTIMVFHLVWHGWVSRNGPLVNVFKEKPQALLYRWMERKIARQVDAIVAISPDIHEDIRRIDDHDQKVHRIPNGVDLNRFHSQEETYDEFTVHFQGRLVEMKNPDVLIEAAARSEGDWRVTFGGEGPLRDDLEALVTKYGLERRIDFLGFVPEDDLPDRYARSHVYALPSTYEGMPLTVLEAAASGTAILASRRAATDFVDETCGWVVKPDPNRIAATLDRAANEIETVVAKGERARERANNFSWGAIAARYENLFDWLVQA